MENITLAVVTLTLFLLLFVVAIFADRLGATLEAPAEEAVVPIPVDPTAHLLGDEPTTLSA